MVIADFIAALDATRAEYAKVDAQIEDAKAERYRIENAPPHADDIIQTLQRGLDEAGRSYRARLASHLSNANASSPRAVAAVQPFAGAQLLTVGKDGKRDLLSPGIADKDGTTDLFPPPLGAVGSVLDAAAVTYFLRDRIAEEIPRLVETMCPAARSGMRQADRVQALARVDTLLTDLTVERDRLGGEISAARAALHRPVSG